MSENFESEQSVNISTQTVWWIGLVSALLMPLCLVGGTLTDPTFNSFKGNEIIIISVAFFSVGSLMIALLSRKTTKRFSVDSSMRSLVFEVFWSGLRVFKRIYPFEIINKFDIFTRMVPSGRYSQQQIDVLALVFQSGKKKIFMGISIQANVKNLAIGLNTLLQDQGGFPSERFIEPLIAHQIEDNKKHLKILYIFIISGLGVVFLIILFMIFVIGPNSSSF
ncbi:hypothetical protein DSAG12_00266 [Promethearchaeum syntrophicum]|uniref:Uncharacterized protein n=1 Tax=Promethearchaeum syntrophicum TaxID=2594042 RepID=A0A5B9D634_9ARCH|nr:hypothetical protein [Candidatus Prometheoarchaeum syntrophicum]QEE14453.1 hypothetical protein DSAG12_00266 [Candidatus Prometheoarchaeum syntrophicum]